MNYFNVVQTGKSFGIGVLRVGAVWTSILRFKTEDFIVPAFNAVFSADKSVYDAQFATRYRKGVSYTIITVAHHESFSEDLVALCKAIQVSRVIESYKGSSLSKMLTVVGTARYPKNEPVVSMNADGEVNWSDEDLTVPEWDADDEDVIEAHKEFLNRGITPPEDQW